MKYDEYKQMKNFSQQQNFDAGTIRAGLGKAWNGLKSTGRFITKPQRKWIKEGSGDFTKSFDESVRMMDLTALKESNGAKLAELKLAQRVAGGPGKNPMVDSQIRSLENETQKLIDQAKDNAIKYGREFARKTKLGVAKATALTAAEVAVPVAAVATVANLIRGNKVNPEFYYIFDETEGGELGSVYGSTKGYATKDEALAVRNEKFPGKRINLGDTLIKKYATNKV